MKVKLRLNDKQLRSEIPWSSCSPFVENTKAVLIHRPRSVSTFKIGPMWKAHIIVRGWCGNSFTGLKKFTFLDAPPKGKFVCERCETRAVQAGEQPSDAIAGRHVHLARFVAKQTCCIKGDQP